jgi:hypothetical protein
MLLVLMEIKLILREIAAKIRHRFPLIMTIIYL